MTTDPGDLVLDPTCGSGTTAYVAEQWGRRWITVDTSRVAVALARSRLMGARYPYYLLADSPDGQIKEAEATRTPSKTAPTHGDIRMGFVYERVPHITLKSIANNAEIDVIWERWQATGACGMVGGAGRAAEGDRFLDRRQSRIRVPQRQALRRQLAHPRRRPLHRREPVAASHACGRLGRRADRHARSRCGQAQGRRRRSR
jgi:DNA methylase